MTSGLWRNRWVVWPAGRNRPPSGPSGATILKTAGVVASASAGRYSKLHWNWAATARTFRFGFALTASTLLRVDHEMMNRNITTAVGISVHMISARLLP